MGRKCSLPSQYHVNSDYRCGGALISTLHILTAAHCISDFISKPCRLLKEEISVRVGSEYLGVGQEFRVKRISQHYNYQRNWLVTNDIGVITVSIIHQRLVNLVKKKAFFYF
ncbi:hypothetical protein QAD02_019849 [Eretmocerus hayati]|uniref:Uncharacterized protein n=1 Tax=Eretmocerus hayati TaxID=131215 RepID=A0ACC2PNZ7_9HYME|nr:hypothetical protein QAD02_019849 [Eretmocerus hayati]